MAAVTVNSGEITATLLARDVPKEKWPELVKKREWFSQVSLTHDCRMVVRFVQEADEMWKALGYASPDDLISRGYGLEPDEIRLVVEWLKLNDPGEAISIDEARAAVAEHGSLRKAAAATGIPKSTLADRVSGCNRTERDQSQRVVMVRGTSPSAAAARIRDRLGDDFADGLKAAL